MVWASQGSDNDDAMREMAAGPAKNRNTTVATPAPCQRRSRFGHDAGRASKCGNSHDIMYFVQGYHNTSVIEAHRQGRTPSLGESLASQERGNAKKRLGAAFCGDQASNPPKMPRRDGVLPRDLWDLHMLGPLNHVRIDGRV
jgi:hypothetical protein